MAVHCAKFNEGRVEREIKSSVQKLAFETRVLLFETEILINLNFNYIPAAQVQHMDVTRPLQRAPIIIKKQVV